ncbi:MAG TPA: SDR family NAD(P)-dependent oxidoreductase [Candidatus Saccharimonadales bacterium]|nr:SDR family NAD(P)-dependent oxidoreductase [Candidatus Saccharimonadales bacterium]
MHTLIIGGSRGIGWELAALYANRGDTVTVTGRKQPEKDLDQVTFKKLNLSSPTYIQDINELVAELGRIDRLVYAPGYYQEGTITDLSESEIVDMVQVCGVGFIFTARAILDTQAQLSECIVITSSSQWTPRKLEPVYNFAKAGIAHFAHALSLDERVNKLMVAGPTGTKTTFHAGRNVDMSSYHEPEWVARQIYEQSQDRYRYKFVKILRGPAKVEVADKE